MGQASSRLFARGSPETLSRSADELIAETRHTLIRLNACLIEKRPCILTGPDGLEVPESIHDELDRGGLIQQGIATFLGKNDGHRIEDLRGVPASWPSAFSIVPSDILAPPILGATILQAAAILRTELCQRLHLLRSDPSAIRMPTARPSSVSFIFFWIESAATASYL